MSSRRRLLRARFEGHVQGVGFRFTTLEIASRNAVTGFVRNLPDGSVDVAVEGEEADVQRFLDELRSSVIYRFVRDETLDWSDAGGEYTSFQVRYDA